MVYRTVETGDWRLKPSIPRSNSGNLPVLRVSRRVRCASAAGSLSRASSSTPTSHQACVCSIAGLLSCLCLLFMHLYVYVYIYIYILHVHIHTSHVIMHNLSSVTDRGSKRLLPLLSFRNLLGMKLQPNSIR